MNNIVEEARKFVEEECKKSTSKYGYKPYQEHFVPMHKYAKLLAEKLGADVEIVEIAAWLHDIGSIIYRRENHHVTGAEISEKKLREFNYPKEKIEKIKKRIFSHGGSQKILRGDKESQIIAEANSLSNFDNIVGLFRVAFVYENLDREGAKKSAMKNLNNSWNKISIGAKEIIAEKYKAAEVLFNEHQ